MVGKSENGKEPTRGLSYKSSLKGSTASLEDKKLPRYFTERILAPPISFEYP